MLWRWTIGKAVVLLDSKVSMSNHSLEVNDNMDELRCFSAWQYRGVWAYLRSGLCRVERCARIRVHVARAVADRHLLATLNNT